MNVQVKCRLLEEKEIATKISQTVPEREEDVVCWIPKGHFTVLTQGPYYSDGSRDATIEINAWLANDHGLIPE